MNLHYGQFLPPNIADCTAWFDAADANTITLNGTDVAQWNDKSGQDNHIAQGTAAYQPTYQATGWGGTDPTIYFDGNNNFLRALDIGKNIFDEGDLTIFIAIRKVAIGGISFSQWASGDTQPTNVMFSLVFGGVNSSLWEYGAGTNESINYAIVGSLNYAVYYLSRNTTALTLDYISIDAGSTLTDLGVPYINQADGGTNAYFYIGGLSTASNAEEYISEFIVYKRVLTEGERLLVTNYLRNKWGI